MHIADYLLDTTNKRDYLLKTHQHIADYLLDSFAYRKLSTIGTFAYCGLHIRLICISLAYFLSKIMQIQSALNSFFFLNSELLLHLNSHTNTSGV